MTSAEAERRQLTVLFCDLVGSTELVGRLDPEDMREVIRAYQDACAGAIVRFEGHIAKFMGDGVLAYFGWPRAHEGEAERAVCAGLQAVRAISTLTPCAGSPLQARVGIATGLVVVGDLVGEGAAQEQAVVGETPNLAARLQVMAEPGSVVIDSTTRRLLGGTFEYADLGIHRPKGFAAPVRAWRVLGSSRAEGRFEARQAASLTPLVGREHELGLLLDRWQQAEEREGQVVLLCGEPGVGKSRLVRALREQLGQRSFTPLSHFCSPFHQGSTLHPVIGLLERGAGLARDDPPERQLDRLEALVALATEDVRAVAPLLADLLAIPSGGRYPPLGLSPQRRKERTFAALLTQLEGLAARQPVLALFEDVHWSDPTTLELLDLIVDRALGSRVLVLITFRPEFRPPWTGFAHLSLLTLSRLNQRQVTAMAERVAGGKALPPEVLEQIAAKTDGVPLFVEELTKLVLETGLLQEEGDRYALTGPLPPLAIPATLYDSLMARLDRLAPAREVAQMGAVIGREFDHELLAAVTPISGNELAHALTELVDSELVFRRGAAPYATYTFKHALVQDAAYASLCEVARQQLHCRIAQVLEERFPETAETQPELLARHFAEAGLAAQAITYLQKAGNRASERVGLCGGGRPPEPGPGAAPRPAGRPRADLAGAGPADRLRRCADGDTGLRGP
jgi:class 3 adenylate cyclase